MAIVTVTPFRRAILSWIRPNLLTYTLRLFTNAHTPVPTDVAANFIEPSGSWYRPIQLTQWGMPFVNSNADAEIDEIVRTWIAAGTVLNEGVYGYFVTNPTGLLVWAETVPSAPLPMSVAGQQVSLTPRLYAGALC